MCWAEDRRKGEARAARPRECEQFRREAVAPWRGTTRVADQRYSAPIGALNATLDRTFFALSDPTRRGILERLGRGPATIGELAKPFGLTINGVKKHVRILEEVDLVATEKVGRTRECQLGAAQLEDARSWIDDYRSTWESRLDRFGSYAEEKHRGR